jgi:hypothetical protein
MRLSLVKTILVSSMLLGCSDPTSSEIASMLNGDWKLRHDPPEGFFGFGLTSNGTDVSGDGAFVGEAGPEGSSSITGSVSGTHVDLDFVLVTELPEGNRTSTVHFTGQLVLGALRGSWQYTPASPDNPPTSVLFVRDDLRTHP